MENCSCETEEEGQEDDIQGSENRSFHGCWPASSPLHAVSGYRGADTSRHLLIVPCLRQED